MSKVSSTTRVFFQALFCFKVHFDVCIAPFSCSIFFHVYKQPCEQEVEQEVSYKSGVILLNFQGNNLYVVM